MAKKFKYDKPLTTSLDPDKAMLTTNISVSSQPQPGPKLPGVNERQSQGRIDLPKARRAIKALQSESQHYFNIGKGKK